jgi:hypothetical protein
MKSLMFAPRFVVTAQADSMFVFESYGTGS